jgi:hypothetical protein
MHTLRANSTFMSDSFDAHGHSGRTASARRFELVATQILQPLAKHIDPPEQADDYPIML